MVWSQCFSGKCLMHGHLDTAGCTQAKAVGMDGDKEENVDMDAHGYFTSLSHTH